MEEFLDLGWAEPCVSIRVSFCVGGTGRDGYFCLKFGRRMYVGSSWIGADAGGCCDTCIFSRTKWNVF